MTPRQAGPRPSAWTFDWESLIGVKLFSAIAGIALVVAAVFFLRYSIEHGWLQPPVRFAIGVAVAVALLTVCELKAARRYPATANAMDAAAVAILFATFFAAYALWHLVSPGVSFLLLALVTALAVVLSIRRDSLFVAVLGLLGGFATPALLSSGENQPVPLFAYLMLLNVGLAWVAYRQRWPILTALSLVLTTVYQWGWVWRFLDASQVPLALGIFVIFPVLGIAALVVAETRSDPARDDRQFERTALLAAAMPLLFAVYLAAVPGYGERPWLLFGFLLLVDAGLLAISMARRQELLYAASAGVTLAVMATWLALSFVPGRGGVALTAAATFVLFFSLAGPLAARLRAPFTGAGLTAGYAAPLLLFVPTVLARTEPAFARPSALFATTLILVLLVAWRAIAESRGALYFVAAFFASGVQGTWSVGHFSAQRPAGPLAWYLLFFIVSLGVPVVARRAGAALQPRGGAGVATLAVTALLVFLAAAAGEPDRVWAIALLVAAATGALFVDSAYGPLPRASVAAGLVSGLFLWFWWLDSAGAIPQALSLAAVVLLSAIVFVAHVAEYVGRRTENAVVPAPATLGTGLFVGLIGHLFLLAFVTYGSWSTPPWSWMTALAVLTIGASAVSRTTRGVGLHRAAVIGAALIVTVWTASAAVPLMMGTAVLASLVVSAFALGWLGVTRTWPPAAHNVAATGAAGALFLGELTAIIVAAVPLPRPFVTLLVAHVLNLSAILALAFVQRWRRVASLAVLPAAAALIVQTGGSGRFATEWPKLLVLAAAIYAVFVTYPAMAIRARRDARDPYVAVVLASAVVFFAAKAALEAGGYRSIVGIVPLLEAVVLGLLLRQLVRAEPVAERDTGRLALVAGAALAFVTVAIPVQLRHQWITVGWALEAAALAWLFGHLRHRGLAAVSAALFAAVFVRLALNAEVLNYHPRGSMRILNWYLYTYALCAAALLFGAWRFHLTGEGGAVSALARWLPAGAVVLLFLLLNIEIADFFATGPTVVFRFGVTVPQDLTYTIGWLMFGMILLGTCIYLRSHAGRVAALALIAITTFKCFLYDLGSLEGLYRVASFVGLATALALVSLALQKYVLAHPEPR